VSVMPTTRYGRYRFYRARQRRRLEKARRRAAVQDEVGGPPGSGATKREWDLSEFTKQMPRSYPLKPNHHFASVGFPTTIDPIPSRGVFGVVHLEQLDGFPLGLHYHHDKDESGAFFRRLKSIPRIRHLPRLPWKHAKEDLLPGAFYQPAFYHSGAPSYRSTLPP